MCSGFISRVRHARGFDDHPAAGAVNAADVAPGLDDEAFGDELQVRLANFLFQFFKHGALLPRAVADLDQSLHHAVKVAGPLFGAEGVVQLL